MEISQPNSEHTIDMLDLFHNSRNIVQAAGKVACFKNAWLFYGPSCGMRRDECLWKMSMLSSRRFSENAVGFPAKTEAAAGALPFSIVRGWINLLQIGQKIVFEMLSLSSISSRSGERKLTQLQILKVHQNGNWTKLTDRFFSQVIICDNRSQRWKWSSSSDDDWRKGIKLFVPPFCHQNVRFLPHFNLFLQFIHNVLVQMDCWSFNNLFDLLCDMFGECVCDVSLLFFSTANSAHYYYMYYATWHIKRTRQKMHEILCRLLRWLGACTRGMVAQAKSRQQERWRRWLFR